MALSKRMQNCMQVKTEEFWRKHVNSNGFQEIAQGKEVGHRIADYVDDKTTSLLKVDFDTRYEADENGLIKRRSMGDVWVKDGTIFNPVNVKAGLQGMNGQPNVVSMQKLLDYILNRWIDSYYLLIVKFALIKPVTQKTVLIDLLEWLEYTTYDAGPGQIMLKEKDFFSAVDRGYKPETLTMTRKVESLFSQFESGVAALIDNRKRRLTRQRKEFDGFDKQPFVVDQSEIKFVP